VANFVAVFDSQKLKYSTNVRLRKGFVFQDVTRRIRMEVNRRFAGIFRFHLQGENRGEAAACSVSAINVYIDV
jgi:hypothetical protein